jgi:hypothetical protein
MASMGLGTPGEGSGFHAFDAAHAPVQTDEAFYVAVLDWADGLELLVVGFGDDGSGGGFFAGEEDVFGAEAVAEVVAAGDGFAFRSFGAGGFLRIVLVGGFLACGGHLFGTPFAVGDGVILGFWQKKITLGCDDPSVNIFLSGRTHSQNRTVLLF